MKLRNQVAIVTGATRGIGRAAFERFAAEGAAVIGLYAANVDLAQQLLGKWNGNGVPLRMVQGSVDDPGFIRELIPEVVREFGRIDILVNNAGIVRDSLAVMMPISDWDDVFRTNFNGTLLCASETIPVMLQQQSGRIVNVVSVSGIYGREAQTNYAASKGAVIGLTKMLARRYGREGIRINAIAPGMIETEMTALVPSGKMENFINHTNMGRMGTVEEIADAILFLASGQSEYISGQVLKADGGFLR